VERELLKQFRVVDIFAENAIDSGAEVRIETAKVRIVSNHQLIAELLVAVVLLALQKLSMDLLYLFHF